MRMMVVATQINVPGSGGGQTHVSELVSHLRQHGPTLLLARDDSHGPDVAPIGLWRGHPPLGLAHAISGLNFVRAWPAVRSFAPEVIYERGSSYGLGAYFSLRLDLPMLTMVLDEHVSPLSLRRARRLITTNPEIVPEPFRHKAVQVSWGANTERFHPEVSPGDARQRLGLGDGVVVAYSGTMQPWHGIDDLCAAAAKLRDLPISYLFIGGKDERLARARAAAEAAGIADRCVFTGQVPYDDMPRLLAAADLCVAPFTPSAHGSTGQHGYALDPLKLFEYLAMAKPTVTVRTPNIERLFRDPDHLRLVEPANASALADAIAWVVHHPDEALAMAKRGMAKVVEHHTWRSHASHLARLFEEIAAEHRDEARGGRA